MGSQSTQTIGMKKQMKLSNWKIKTLSAIALGLMVLGAFAPMRANAATTIQGTDFQQGSFSRVTDWYDYVRQYAAANGLTPPDSSEHAYLYTNYINVNGFQLFYIGLVNATHNGRYVTIPLQSFFEHYKSPGGKTAITASSFISLVTFQENGSTIYPNSPDKNDTLYASFSLGVDLTAFAGHPVPSYVATSQVIPLTSTDSFHWTWGLKYTNLNAVWWRIGVDPLNPCCDPLFSIPRALSRYSELTFSYDLAIDPTTKIAKLTTSYAIGQVTDLYLLTQSPVQHLNATGSYYLNGTRVPGPTGSQTVYDYLTNGRYMMSIVLANKAILASHTTTDKDASGNSVDDSENDVSQSAVDTKADDGETVFRANFGVKSSYALYDTSGSTYTNHTVTTRTVRRPGWGGNPVFAFQNHFMGFLPLFVAHVDPALFKQAQAGMVSLAVADYLYVIAYPQWGGTRIVHDPDFTAFYQPAGNAGLLVSLFIAVAVAAAVGGLIAFLLRRRRATSVVFGGATGATPPGQGPIPTGPPAPGR